MSINPLDDANGSSFVLLNDEDQHTRWPVLADVPAGWRALYGEADGVACLNCIEHNWPDMRPKNLRQMLAAGRAIDN